jgi:hypothetical protein
MSHFEARTAVGIVGLQNVEYCTILQSQAKRRWDADFVLHAYCSPPNDAFCAEPNTFQRLVYQRRATHCNMLRFDPIQTHLPNQVFANTFLMPFASGEETACQQCEQLLGVGLDAVQRVVFYLYHGGKEQRCYIIYKDGHQLGSRLERNVRT